MINTDLITNFGYNPVSNSRTFGAAVGSAYRAGVAVHEGKSAREVVGSAIKGAAEGALIMSKVGVLVSTGVSVAADATLAEQVQLSTKR